MWYSKGKIWAARVAAQAIALAVRDAGGDMVGVLFDDTWLIGAGWGDALLFAPGSWPTEGGTYFAFLSDLWRRYPSHWVVLVIARPAVSGADGDGYVPYAATPDRARTGTVVIPDGKPEKMAEICNSVIVLKDPRDLPCATPALAPQRRCRCRTAHPPGHGRLASVGLTSRHRGLIFMSGQRLSCG